VKCKQRQVTYSKLKREFYCWNCNAYFQDVPFVRYNSLKDKIVKMLQKEKELIRK